MSFSRNPLFTLVPATLALLISAAALGQAPAKAPVLVKPEPIAQFGKFMPGFGDDGVAMVRYTVKADGTTDNVEVTGYMGSPFFSKGLSQTVSKWTFKPGTADGKAVDYVNQEYLFVSKVDPNAPPPPAQVSMGSRQDIKEKKMPPKPDPGAAPPAAFDPGQVPLALSLKAKQTIDAAYEQLKNKQYDAAIKALDEVAGKDLHTVYDFALVNQLRSTAYFASNRPYEALEALELATMNGTSLKGDKMFFLEDKLLEQALRQRFLLATSLRHNKLAWDTYQLLQEKFPLAADDKMHAEAKAVKALLDAPDQLALLAKITGDKGEWTHVPSRRIFTVADVKGKLEKVTARCERRTVDLKYQENADWTLPASFGACSLVFLGDKGTQFTVYEFNQ